MSSWFYCKNESFHIAKILKLLTLASCCGGTTEIIYWRIKQSKELPHIHLVQLIRKILGESEWILVRGIQIQTLKLFFNLELNIDLVLRYLHWVSDGDLKSMWLKWRRYILASCITEILCPEQNVLERPKDCNLIYKLHSHPAPTLAIYEQVSHLVFKIMSSTDKSDNVCT